MFVIPGRVNCYNCSCINPDTNIMYLSEDGCVSHYPSGEGGPIRPFVTMLTYDAALETKLSSDIYI